MQALLVIDMQRFVSDRIARGMEYFPAASIENMKTILASFRAAGKTVLHVRHETIEPGSDLQKIPRIFHRSKDLRSRAKKRSLSNEPRRRLVRPISTSGYSARILTN